MSNSLRSLSAVQLKQAAALMEQIEKLEAQLSRVLGGASPKAKATEPAAAPRGKNNMSAEGRARIAAAQKKRWAKFHAASSKKSK